MTLHLFGGSSADIPLTNLNRRPTNYVIGVGNALAPHNQQRQLPTRAPILSTTATATSFWLTPHTSELLPFNPPLTTTHQNILRAIRQGESALSNSRTPIYRLPLHGRFQPLSRPSYHRSPSDYSRGGWAKWSSNHRSQRSESHRNAAVLESGMLRRLQPFKADAEATYRRPE